VIDRRQLAEQFVVFCCGVEEGGQERYAQVGRTIADLFLQALNELEAERSARVAAQERAERWEAIARVWATKFDRPWTRSVA